jgi:hypothetical protein
VDFKTTLSTFSERFNEQVNGYIPFNSFVCFSIFQAQQIHYGGGKSLWSLATKLDLLSFLKRDGTFYKPQFNK